MFGKIDKRTNRLIKNDKKSTCMLKFTCESEGGAVEGICVCASEREKNSWLWSQLTPAASVNTGLSPIPEGN